MRRKKEEAEQRELDMTRKDKQRDFDALAKKYSVPYEEVGLWSV